MHILKYSLVVILLLSAGTSAQTTPGGTPAPQPTPNANQERQRQDEEMRRRGQEFNRLRNISPGNARRRPIPASTLFDLKKIYRDATAREREVLAPEKTDVQKLAAFLRQKNTGLVRLADNSECAGSPYLISASTKCLEYPMPGNGAFFSFRRAGYSIDRIADLRYRNGMFAVGGIFQHGILTRLGDIDPDTVSVSTPGMGYLMDFKPSLDIVSAVSVGRELRAGIDRKGFHYRQELKMVENMTYALRSVAYRGTVMRSYNGVIYDELDFDKRFDVTVVFKVVRVHDDGSVTIAWKRLLKKESPKLKMETPDQRKPVNSRFTAAASVDKTRENEH